MTYEKALELKEAGFPQTIKNGVWFPYASDDTREKVYIPTLEELIEACGVGFKWLGVFHKEEVYPNKEDIWVCGKYDDNGDNGDYFTEQSRDKTPKIAVANLYLVLNKK
jgi:hypothetical protein